MKDERIFVYGSNYFDDYNRKSLYYVIDIKNGNLINLKFENVDISDEINIIQMDDGIVCIFNINKSKMYLLDIKEKDYEIVQSYNEFNGKKLIKSLNH